MNDQSSDVQICCQEINEDNDVEHAGNKLSKVMVRLSLTINIVVLIAVCTVLIAFGNSEPVVYAWGIQTAGRGILLSIYFSILVASILLLALHIFFSNLSAIEHMIAALLSVQILYKISTPVTAGPENPVAISNLCISAFHLITTYLIWRNTSNKKE